VRASHVGSTGMMITFAMNFLSLETRPLSASVVAKSTARQAWMLKSKQQHYLTVTTLSTPHNLDSQRSTRQPGPASFRKIWTDLQPVPAPARSRRTRAFSPSSPLLHVRKSAYIDMGTPQKYPTNQCALQPLYFFFPLPSTTENQYFMLRR